MLFPETKFIIENGYNGLVTVQKYGINGTICTQGWDETDANVTCQMAGYAGGVVFGPPEVYVRKMPVWYSDMQCKGTETSLDDCARKSTVSLKCMTSIKNAGVLCYNSSGIYNIIIKK